MALVLVEPVERVAKHLDVEREILRKLGRPHERDFGPVLAGDGRDLGVVSAYDDALDVPGRAGMLDGIGDRGLSGQLEQVLAWDPFRATAGGNERENRAHDFLRIGHFHGFARLGSSTPNSRQQSRKGPVRRRISRCL